MPSSPDEPDPRRVGDASDVVAAYEHAPVALATLGGPEPRYLTCNAAYRHLYGDLRGRRPADVLPARDAEEFTDLLERARATGRSMEFREWRFGVEDDDEMFLDVMVEPARDLLHVSVSDATSRVRRQQRTDEAMAALQDELLPRGLAVLPGLDTAACYLLADPSEARGDWFDVVVRPDGTVALVVGDVVGDGMTAAAAMGQLRAVLHERLASDESLDRVLMALDDYAASGAESYGATACVAVVDRVTGTVEYVTAGHPPPIVVADGAASHLGPSGGSPLGTGWASRVARHRLDVGDVLLLHTDGLVERPGRSLGTEGIRMLATVEEVLGEDGESRRAVVRATQGLLERVAVRSGDWVDDATVLAAQRVRVSAPFSVEHPAIHGDRAAVGEEVSRWLAGLEVGPLDAAALRHAVDELVANVATHAYRDDADPGSVLVRLDVGSRGAVIAEVSDRGRWREPDGSGHGLAVVRALMDSTEVDQGADGTRVCVTFGVSRPAPLLTSRGRSRPDDVRMDAVPVGDVLVVTGPVETRDADRFRTLLYHHAPAPGGRDHVVDLTGVTLLGGAGVQALLEVTSRCAGLRLLARPGSVAQQVLELVRLPYES